MKRRKEPKDTNEDIEKEMEMLGIDDDEGFDLDELGEDKEKTKDKKSTSDKEKDEVIKKVTKRVMESMSDRFVKGIIAKVEVMVSTFTPDEPLTDEEKNSLEMDLNMILTSEDILEKIAKLPMWVGVLMLVFSVVMIIGSRLMKPKKEDIAPKIPENQQPYIEPKQKPKKKTTKKKAKK